MRLREEKLWHDPPQWYGTANGDATGNKSPLEMTQREQTKAVIREFLKKQEASKVEL